MRLHKDQQVSRYGRNSHIWSNISSHCDPELEDRKPIFLHDILAHYVASPYQIWLQKVQQQRRYRSHEHSLELWTSSVTLTSTTTQKSNNPLTRQSTLWWCAIKPSLLAEGISSSENILKSHILITLFLTVTLTLKTANQSFWKTIWLMMMHHHTKFGSKRFNESENIVWTNIHWHFEILMWPWPWTQQSNFSIKHSSLWSCTIKSSVVAKG